MIEFISKHSTINMRGVKMSSVAVVNKNSVACRVMISDTCLEHSHLDNIHIVISNKCVMWCTYLLSVSPVGL